MGKRKRNYKLEDFETKDFNGILSTTANLTRSKIYDDAFLSLNFRQRCLFTYMQSEYYGKAKDDLSVFPEEYRGKQSNNKPKLYFTFNWAKAQRIGYTNKQQFYNDINALIEKGFIDCIIDGQPQKQKSLYKFSSRWKKYGTKDYQIDDRVRTYSGARKQRNRQRKENS